VVVQGARSLVIDGVEVGRSFTLKAIGSPEGLFAALNRPGGIVAQLEQFVSASIVVEERKAADGRTLTVPATRIGLAPKVATPIQ
jgi:uncharacterized protein YlxW (UPF0749 family)